jgi:UDP-N-acetyl-D-mannosaminuronate dehydrogenase
MDKYEQIVKLAEAAALIQNVIASVNPEFRNELQTIADDIANIADDIEMED